MAHHIITTLLTAALLNVPSAATTPTERANINIVVATDDQAEIAAWALGRYETAGLELPPLTIRFSDPTPTGCDRAAARVHLDESPIRIEICWSNPFILLHELAHIWEARNVPEAKHATFIATRIDVESWASLDVPWNQRGREHAANVIAWDLLEEPFPISRTYPNNPDQLRDAYHYLTGNQPLHDGGSPIATPDRSFFTPDRANTHLETRQ